MAFFQRLFLRLHPSSSKFLLAAQLCLPRGLSPSLPFPFSPLCLSLLPAVCLPASGSDLSISHKLSVPSPECPLTLIRLELPTAFPFAEPISIFIAARWELGPHPQSEQVKVDDTETWVCVHCFHLGMQATWTHLFCQSWFGIDETHQHYFTTKSKAIFF